MLKTMLSAVETAEKRGGSPSWVAAISPMLHTIIAMTAPSKTFDLTSR